MASKQDKQSTTSGTIERSREALMAQAQAAMGEMKSSNEYSMDDVMFDTMAATSLDELLNGGGDVIHLKDIIGVPFTINRAELQDSKYADGLPAYVVMHVTFDDGTDGVVITGATQIVSGCIKMHSEGWFPARVSTIMLTSSNGNDVIKFSKPD